MEPLKNYRERRQYTFPCVKCGRPRAKSYRRGRAKVGLCRPCRKGSVDERQQTMFPTTPPPGNEHSPGAEVGGEVVKTPKTRKTRKPQ